MTAPPRFLIRLSYRPSLVVNRLMCALGLWNPWDVVDEHVLLGAQPTRNHMRVLRQLGVTGIVNLCEEFHGHQREMAAQGIIQLHLPTMDYHCPTVEDLQRGLQFLLDRRDQNHKTLIHCKAGRGRSATLGLCYLMATKKLSASDAFQWLRRKRPLLTRRLDAREPVRSLERFLRGECRP